MMDLSRNYFPENILAIVCTINSLKSSGKTPLLTTLTLLNNGSPIPNSSSISMQTYLFIRKAIMSTEMNCIL